MPVIAGICLETPPLIIGFHAQPMGCVSRRTCILPWRISPRRLGNCPSNGCLSARICNQPACSAPANLFVPGCANGLFSYACLKVFCISVLELEDQLHHTSPFARIDRDLIHPGGKVCSSKRHAPMPPDAFPSAMCLCRILGHVFGDTTALFLRRRWHIGVTCSRSVRGRAAASSRGIICTFAPLPAASAILSSPLQLFAGLGGTSPASRN